MIPNATTIPVSDTPHDDPHGARTNEAFWRARQPRCEALPDGGSEPSWLGVVKNELPKNAATRARALEVGVVPGHMLLYFASQMDYECTGVDLSATVHDVAQAFENQGASAKFVQADFMDWAGDETYDLVYSCGFVEHFDDPAAIIERHWRLVAPGGLMVISVPVLSPYQLGIRKLTYTRTKFREMTTSHNVPFMKLAALRRVVAGCSGGRVVLSTHTREMTVWFGPGSQGVRPWTAPVFPVVRRLERLGRRIGRSSGWFSPEAVVAVRKAQ